MSDKNNNEKCDCPNCMNDGQKEDMSIFIKYTNNKLEARFNGSSKDVISCLIDIYKKDKQLFDLVKTSLTASKLNPPPDVVANIKKDFLLKLESKGISLSFEMEGSKLHGVMILSFLFNQKKDLAKMFQKSVDVTKKNIYTNEVPEPSTEELKKDYENFMKGDHSFINELERLKNSMPDELKEMLINKLKELSKQIKEHPSKENKEAMEHIIKDFKQGDN